MKRKGRRDTQRELAIAKENHMKQLNIFAIHTERSEVPFLQSVGDLPVVGVSKSRKYPDGLLSEITLGFAAFDSADKQHRIRLYSLTEAGYLPRCLPLFKDTFLEDNFLGCIFCVDVKYRVIEEHEYTQYKLVPTEKGNKLTKPEKRIEPEQRGWLRVPNAVFGHKIFKELEPDAPYVVAIINHDTPNAMPLDKLHDELQVGEKIKLIPCNPEKRSDVKHVLLELMAILKPSSDIESATKLIESL
jgi:hypothetical protein